MKEKIDFLLCYEHKAREFETIVLIKRALEERGYKVKYRCLYQNSVLDYPQYKEVKPKCVIVPAAYDRKILECFCFNIVGFVKKIINLQWEQILTVEEESDVNAYHNPKGIAKNVVHLCWGNKTKKRLVNSGVKENKIFITGPVHLDFLRPQFRSCLYTKDYFANLFNLKKEKKWILFISSFGYCDLDERMKDYITSCYGEDYVNYFIDFSKKSRTEILEWLKKLINKTDEYEIIYRPHPDEIKVNNELSKLSLDNKNFHVIKDYAVKNWINSCDIILNWFSTSRADVVFLDKKEIVLRPIQIRDKDEVSIMKGEDFCCNYEDFLHRISFQNEAKVNSLIYDYYDVDKNIPSYERVADICELVLKNKDYNLKYSFMDYFDFYIKVLKYSVFKIFRKYFYFLPITKHFMQHFEDSEKFLKEGQISNIGTNEEEIEIIKSHFKEC